MRLHDRPYRGSKRQEIGERGFTFLVVIWALSVLIVLGLVFGASVSAHLKTTRNAMDNARAEAFADAGIELAVLDISAWRAQTAREPRFPRNGRPVRCSLGNGDWLRIAVEDEAGKVDLNAADERLIAAALIAAGVADDAAAGYAESIIDYRDSDSSRRPHGAERQEYRDVGRTGPKNEPFDTIEEVEQVLGIPAGLADALRAYATVYSGEMSIDGNLASRHLLAAISSPRGGELRREEPPSLLEGFVDRPAPGTNLVTAAGGRAFRILAQAHTAQGAVFVREAVVEFVANRPGAFLFRRWRKASATLADSETDSLIALDMPAC
jgi:general secretion pathway protein K